MRWADGSNGTTVLEGAASRMGKASFWGCSMAFEVLVFCAAFSDTPFTEHGVWRYECYSGEISNLSLVFGL